MNENKNYLVEAPLGKLLKAYSLPCVISLLVAALYNIVDQLFIANATYLGSYGNAANTAVFPLTIVALAIAVMIGDGCCALVSLSLGSGEKAKASSSVGNSIVISLGASILLTALYLVFQHPLLCLFGANVNPETYAMARQYFFYICLGLPFYMFGQTLNPIIRSDGSPKFAMASTLAGAVMNLILDPIFIFGFHWGMMGAAVATVAGQILTAALAVWYLFHLKTVKLQRQSFALKAKVIFRGLSLGLCSFVSQISLVAAMAACNSMIRIYGAADPVFSLSEYSQIPLAVVGIVMKFFQIVISICIGLAAGCIPIVGFNLGAGRPDRARQLFFRMITLEALVGLVSLIIVEIFPNSLIMLFGAANESPYYTDFAVKAFRIYLSMAVLACVNKATFIYLQALGKALASTVLSIIREVVFGVGFALLLPRFFGLDGVLYSMPASDLLTFFIALFLIFRIVVFQKPAVKAPA